MIKKLRFKFMLMTMAALLLVLTIIIAGINIVNYHSILQDADELLLILSENRGMFTEKKGAKDDDRDINKLPPDMSPEAPYETRYFSVTLNSTSGDLIQVDTGHIASVERADAIRFAQSVLQNKKDKGFVGSFRYTVHVEDETTRIIFLHCGKKLDSFQNFLFASIGISLIGYGVVCLIIAFFSNRIIRPISESYEKQKRFITDAGHEIKTPLTIINADVDVLTMDLGENEWLEDIQKQAKRLASLTNDLVYLSRMEESADSMQMIEFPFSDIVSETASSFQALAQTQDKVFECRIQPMLSINGNEKAIRQLVNILLDNALKYSPAGGTVSLVVEKQSKALRLTVSNTTKYTIPQENLHLLFERFYRLDPSRNSQTGGYGIGLSVAKAIANAHNGKIQAKTEDGKSLQITASFPI
ncbi:MAG: GHKL domain-containing protein [Roseburia sp.]|nr:GHKL domain-containing protein [Roseburia sp.]